MAHLLSRSARSRTPSLLAAALPRAVIFDLDGLLVDSEPLHAAAYVEAFADAGLSLDPEEYRCHITLGGGHIRDLLRAKGGDAAAWPGLFQRKVERYRRLIHEEMALLPGAEALLSALAGRGTPCLLATGSGRVNAEMVLERFGLERYFPVVLTGDDVRRAKPDPEVFLLASGRLGVPPAELVCLEDSPKGVEAAAAAGAPCVAVPTAWTRGGDLSRAALVVESLEQVTPQELAQVSAAFRRMRRMQ